MKDGKDWDAYFPLYWLNYGTKDKRDSQHQFVKARKAISSGQRNGIRPRRFVDQAWEQTKGRAEQICTSELITQTNKFLAKYAV